MNFDFMTREIWDAIIVGAMIIALALAVVRLYADFARKRGDDD